MSTAVCSWCDGYVEASNVRHPGFCSADCRDADRQHRQDEHDRRRQVRAAARDKAEVAVRAWPTR